MPPPPQAGYRQEDLFFANFFSRFLTKKICDVSGCFFFDKKKTRNPENRSRRKKIFREITPANVTNFLAEKFFCKFRKFFFANFRTFLTAETREKFFRPKKPKKSRNFLTPLSTLAGVTCAWPKMTQIEVFTAEFAKNTAETREKRRKNFTGHFIELFCKFFWIFLAIFSIPIFLQKYPPNRGF